MIAPIVHLGRQHDEEQQQPVIVLYTVTFHSPYFLNAH